MGKSLPLAIGWGAGCMHSWIKLLPKLGWAFELDGIEMVDSIGVFEILGARAGWLLAGIEGKAFWIWELPLLAKSITSLALSAGKSLKTITLPA